MDSTPVREESEGSWEQTNVVVQNDIQKWCKQNYLNYRSLRSAQNVREQLLRLLNKLGLVVDYGKNVSDVQIKKALIPCYFNHVAYLHRAPGKSAQTYLTMADNQVVAVHPSSTLQSKPEWVMFHEFVLTSKSYIRTVTAVEPRWLIEVCPRFYANLEEEESAISDGPAKSQLRKLLS